MFRSFFWGGFECATGCNAQGERIDRLAATEHDRQVAEDYRLLRQTGLRTAREGVRWPIVDRGDGHYDFSSLDPMLAAARTLGVQLVLDLFHYGYPDEADPFDPDFPLRFADYCRAVAEHVALFSEGPYVFTPVNQPSFFAWAAGEAGIFGPQALGRSQELKIQLARCAIQGIDAIRSVLPQARILNVDPICRAVAPANRPDLEVEAQRFNEEVVFECLDMIAGRLLPELGGSDRHLDLVGLSYYVTNQWELGRENDALPPNDPRAWPLRDILRWAYHRYNHDIVLTETAHEGDDRARWIDDIATEVEAALDEGVPIRGVCLYPVLGTPEWDMPEEWARMGLWDVLFEGGSLRRIPYRPGLEALRNAQMRLEGLSFTAGGVPRLLTDGSLY